MALMSDYESSGMAALEAIAMGRRVLLADTTGLRELGAHPLVSLVPLDSSTAQLADALVRELSIDESIVPPLSIPSWDDCVERLLEIYQATAAKCA